MTCIHELQSNAPRALIFDLDGTLVDSLADIASALNEALESLGLKSVDKALARTWIGDGLPMLCQRAAVHAGVPNRAETLLDAARSAYETHCTRTTALFPKMLEILNLLRDAEIPMAVLSNKPHEFVDRIVRHLGLENHFAAWRGYLTEADKKPSPRAALKLMEMFGLPVDDVAIVGDSMVDFETARNANMRFIAVRWGIGAVENFSEKNPDWIIDSPEELRKIFFIDRS